MIKSFSPVGTSLYDMVCIYTKEWDSFVDNNFKYMEEAGFNIKFWGPKSERIFKIFLQFIDMIAMDFDQKQFEPKILVASLMYLIIGGKDLMAAFDIEYNLMYENFIVRENGFPILEDDIGFNTSF